MIVNTRRYEELCETFTRQYPMWAERAIDSTLRHGTILRVVLDTGDCIDYNDLTKTYRYVNKSFLEKSNENTDEACREIFAYNLSNIMRIQGVGQVELSERTGLSTAIISKYLNKKSTPTMTSIRKIAHALGCTSHELLD